MKIIQRLDEANRRISDSWQFWNYCKTGGIIQIGAYERHIFSNEEAVYMLRRAADELVSFTYCFIFSVLPAFTLSLRKEKQGLLF